MVVYCIIFLAVVWVAPDLRVYLLVDFPVLLQKQQAFASWEESPNPRVEDIKAVQKLYEQILKPYTTLNTSWVSFRSVATVYLLVYSSPGNDVRIALKLSVGSHYEYCTRCFARKLMWELEKG